MGKQSRCWKKCLKGRSGIPWWAVALIIALAGALIAATGGQIVLFGIALAATLGNIGIAVGAGSVMAIAMCMLGCRG